MNEYFFQAGLGKAHHPGFSFSLTETYMAGVIFLTLQVALQEHPVSEGGNEFKPTYSLTPQCPCP